MEVTAILEKDGDWSSLQGWLNHTTGELVSPSRAAHVFPLLISGFIGSSACTSLDNAMSIAIVLFFSVIALVSGSMLWRAHRAHRALAALPRSAPAS